MLTNQISLPQSSLDDFFPSELYYKGPKLIICNHNRTGDIYPIIKYNWLNTYPHYYSENIDVESNLIGINNNSHHCNFIRPQKPIDKCIKLNDTPALFKFNISTKNNMCRKKNPHLR